ncbi:hypothetical protein SUGI_0945330 [Cryptomeria japonica]|uniref:F-box/kelch-repeat protein At3g61590 n=1 Tax=Cryptomeria japonica TaxID=3369 RepID=UPI0024148F1B|nr:F-box/kelch-repeat protein At3g61590 [Cryptomeria japonica]XP_057838175.1 F-box/kelch-repeat protein At3g61590 [Cryptomeria japonica]GLJ44902.1 hypothetical protein SUGI_0945330 [Cryptomeria japonica]
MEGTTSWASFTTRLKEIGKEVQVRHRDLRPEPIYHSLDFETHSDNEDCSNEETLLCIDSVLPDDLLERILSFLPIASVFRAGTVCKRWRSITLSEKFLWQCSKMPAQKPWYFMFTNSEDPSGFAFDPVLKKWYNFSLPCIGTSSWFVASSFGLVCFMDNANRNHVYVCNPITRNRLRLPEPPEPRVSDYSALAITVNKHTNTYIIVVARSKQVPHDYLQWNLSIDVYDSLDGVWNSSVSQVLNGWRGGDEAVICNGILYCLIYSTAMSGNSENRHGLIIYDTSNALLQVLPISMPCSLTCGRLMNLKERLVMVGGIGRVDRPDIIKGIGIWELDKVEWREISRMPHRFFQGFGEFDDVFSSSGTGDLIYIQSYGAPALLVFDMNQKSWRWSQKCPVTKRFPLQLFTGFCFEPRFEVAVSS